jgi:hypothetical protein
LDSSYLNILLPPLTLLPLFLCVSRVFLVSDFMDQQQKSTSPKFYRNAAILFFVIGCILVWQAIVRHDWVFGAFAGITLLNALMTTFKLISLRETKQ